jgi:hypothetical protein
MAKTAHRYTYDVRRVYISGSDIFGEEQFTVTVNAQDEDEAERKVKKLVKDNVSYSYKFKINLTHIEE